MPPVILDIIIKGTDHSRGMLVGFRQGVRGAAADTSGLKGHLDKLDSSLGGLNRDLDGLGGRWQNLSAARVGMGMTAMGVGGAAAIGLMGRATLKASSDLNESNSKAGVVFGDAVDKVRAMADTAASAMGQSKQQALESAATFGNLFLGLGMGQEKAADLSIKMVQLATDLSSFNNIPMDVALEKIRSGLVGEVEPLRTVGVLLSEEKVALKAVEMGLAGNKNAVSEQAKVQARYALILEQTKTAQGDFARTSDGLANQQRILAAEFENTKAAVGDALAPAVSKLLKDLMPLVDQFAKWAKDNPEMVAGLAKAAVGITAVNLTVGPLLMNSRALLSTWQLLSKARPLVGAAVSGFAGFIGRGGLAGPGKQIGGETVEYIGSRAGGIGARIGGAIGEAMQRQVPVWAKIGSAIGGAAAGAMIGWQAGKMAAGQKTEWGAGLTLGGGALAGGLAGAAAGTILAPGMGTLIGGLLGAIAGSMSGILAYLIAGKSIIAEGEARAKAAEEYRKWRESLPPEQRRRYTEEYNRLLQEEQKGPPRPISIAEEPAYRKAMQMEAWRRATGGGPNGPSPPTGEGLSKENKKKWEDSLDALQQQVDRAEVGGAGQQAVYAAEMQLARGYRQYALTLRAAGDSVEAGEADLKAMRIEQQAGEAKRKAYFDALQQQIDWLEAAGADDLRVGKAKQELGLAHLQYAANLRRAGQVAEAVEEEIAAMRLGVARNALGMGGQQETWKQIGFGADRQFESSTGKQKLQRRMPIEGAFTPEGKQEYSYYWQDMPARNVGPAAQAQPQAVAATLAAQQAEATRRRQAEAPALQQEPEPSPVNLQRGYPAFNQVMPWQIQPRQRPSMAESAPLYQDPRTSERRPLTLVEVLTAGSILLANRNLGRLAGAAGQAADELAGHSLTTAASAASDRLALLGGSAQDTVAELAAARARLTGDRAEPLATDKQGLLAKAEGAAARVLGALSRLSFARPPVPTPHPIPQETPTRRIPTPSVLPPSPGTAPLPAPAYPRPLIVRSQAPPARESVVEPTGPGTLQPSLVINPKLEISSREWQADWRRDREESASTQRNRVRIPADYLYPRQALRSDVVSPGRDAAARNATAAGREGPPVINTELHIEIDGHELRGMVRSEVVEVSRGAGRQP